MSKRPSRNHAPAFKVKVALDALKGQQRLVELSQRYQIHPTQIIEWKKQRDPLFLLVSRAGIEPTSTSSKGRDWE